MTTELTTFNFEITSLQQAMDYAKLIADSDLAPKDYKGKPGNVLIAIQYGVEIGLKPMQSIQNIAVINGRPCIWGDAMMGLVQSHPVCEYIKEEIQGDTAFCTTKRKGEPEYTYSFSIDDAKKAGLWGKTGPWSQYPKRMLQMRARAFALRDKFSDVLKGIAMREEIMDYQNAEYKVVQSDEVSKLNDSLGLTKNDNKLLEQDKPAYDMSALSKSINESENLLALEIAYKVAYKTAKSNPDHINVLTELKDKRKNELTPAPEVEAKSTSTELDQSWEEFKNEQV